MSNKIDLDKYYTPSEIVDKCIQITREVLKGEKVSEIIEPSAGNGAFSLKLPQHLVKAYDLEPEHESVIKQNYLELELPYKENRLIIGNPPYGKGNYLSVKFFKRAITQGDFIAFILPISQLNNNMYMYEFDMVHSEDLGKQKYSGRIVHCCFNVYKRNPNGYNKKPNYDLEDVSLRGVATGKSRNDKVPEKYDFSVSGFGASHGKFCENEGQYCQQIYFTINNQDLKDKILSVIKETNWKELYGMTATPKIKHWMINKRLKQMIPEIK